MTCYGKDGSSYEVVWQGNLQSLPVRLTDNTFVATYHGYTEQISSNAFKVVANGHGGTLTVIFEGTAPSLHADRNSDGSQGGTDACSLTGGGDEREPSCNGIHG
jgi:hypothetical protein